MSLLVKSGRKWVKVSRSDSDFDNIESITMGDIAPGTYRLAVRGDRAEAYSLAWMTSQQDDHGGGGSNSGPGSTDLLSTLSSGEISPTAVPEPGLMGLVVVAMGMLARRRRERWMTFLGKGGGNSSPVWLHSAIGSVSLVRT